MNYFGYVIELSIHLVQVLDPLGGWFIFFSWKFDQSSRSCQLHLSILELTFL